MNEPSLYGLSAPKFFREQTVNFRLHNGAVRQGIIGRVETHYDRNNDAYHIYSIRREGVTQHVHVGEENIIEVAV